MITDDHRAKAREIVGTAQPGEPISLIDRIAQALAEQQEKDARIAWEKSKNGCTHDQIADAIRGGGNG